MPATKTYSNSLVALIKEILTVFYANNKKQFYFLIFIVFFSSFAEVISFTLIIPVIYFINDPVSVQQIKGLHVLYKFFQFDTVGHFTLFLLLGLVFVFLIKNLFLLFSIYVQNKFVYSVANDILNKQLADFYNNDYLDIKKNNSVEYLRCFLEVPHGFADMLMMPVIFILNEFLVLIIILIFLLYYMPSVLLLLLVTIVPVGYLMIFIAKKKLQENSDKKSSIEKEAYQTVLEGVNAYRDVKLFNKETTFIHSILSVFKDYYDVLIMKNVYIFTPRRIIEVLVIASICIIYFIAFFGLHASKNQMVLVLLAFSTAAYRLLPSLNEIVTNIVRIRTSSYLIDLLHFIKSPEIIEKEYTPICFSDKIELANICFSYKENSNRILNDFNMTINKGEFVILKGDSGAGKTTIGKIVTGFVKPDSGKYYIDNYEVMHINQIKSFIGYVTQDFYLFDKTLLENIAIGETMETVDIDKIKKIIKLTNLKDFVDTLPNGIHQSIGEMGSKLSGGQRQRIAIARALYKDIELLVLDEATSSLDNENEQEILNTIYDISKKTNLTVLLITHRASAVSRFDTGYEFNNNVLTKFK